MATVKELKATARPRAGKGAARALRRQGSVPGVIYGGDQPPLPIALEHIAVRNNIYAGRFLTTIYHLDLDGQTHRVLGTVYADGLPRVLRIDGYSMDMVPEGQMVVIVNHDQPGVIGFVGSTFGDANVNIADMVISREFDSGGKATAIMVIKTDSPAPASLLEQLRARPNIVKVKSLVLPARPK